MTRTSALSLSLFLGLVALVSAAAMPAAAIAAQTIDASRLPAFEGRTLDGKRLATSSFAGKRLLLLCFNPGVEQAQVYAKALAAVAPEQTRHNFAIAAVAMGLDPQSKRDFAKAHRLTFPIFDDTEGEIAARLGLQSPLMLVGTDPQGHVGLAMLGFENDGGTTADAVEARIRDYLRLPRADALAAGKLDQLPMAPPFEAPRLDGGSRFRLSDLAGRPAVLTFFLSTCPHCQDALRFFQAELAKMPEKTRPAFVGIAIDGAGYTARTELQEKKLDFFPVLRDPDGSISAAYGSFARVPDILLLDKSGRIVHRNMGWDEKHDPDVMRMHLARMSGKDVPMLLSRDGFSGNDACAACHPSQAATWHFTEHSLAFDTLVTAGSDRDPKCVGCHVVGFGERGGWSEAGREKHFENVGCESCHGRGGGHLSSGGKAAAVDYPKECARCHDATHSLGFDFTTFLPKVSHASLASMTDADRAALVAGRDRPRDLLPTTAAYVGSSACRQCHEREYDIWSRSAHAHSAQSLLKKGKSGEAQCVRCHVTGFGRPGGFPEDERARHGDELARVGCESCHGPGGDHVKDGGKRTAGIVRLGDKCESCVILQICGSCHDEANDPEFRFRVQQKIAAQRHGTTTSAAGGKPAPAH